MGNEKTDILAKEISQKEFYEDEDTYDNVEAFWIRLGNELNNGTFWADEIKGLYNKPLERLQLAVKNLPLPAAFRQSVISLRALIRIKRKSNECYNNELAALYWLAATNSFYKPYAKKLKEPGFNVVEIIPKSIINSMMFDYRTLGYKELQLLNNTDVMWLTENWGEPKKHTTLLALYSHIWDEYEDKLIKKRGKKFKDVF